MASKSASRPLLAWRYNDEELLNQLRSGNPKMSWKDIQGMFNHAVPSRPRTVDELEAKWKSLKYAKASTPLENKTVMHDTHVNQLVESASDYHSNSSVSNQLVNSELALCQEEQPWIDSLGIYWEGVEDVDRYGFEHEEYQEMRRLAVEVACGNRSNRS